MREVGRPAPPPHPDVGDLSGAGPAGEDGPPGSWRAGPDPWLNSGQTRSGGDNLHITLLIYRIGYKTEWAHLCFKPCMDNERSGLDAGHLVLTRVSINSPATELLHS